MVQNRERQPHNQLRLIVSLCWHVCWVLLLATGAVSEVAGCAFADDPPRRRAALLEARADQLPASNRSCPHRACCSRGLVLSVGGTHLRIERE